jgi:nucleotide-binding universal stress UspA family protein
MTLKRILVGVDGSDGSARALEWAVDLARDLEAEIVAAYAFGHLADGLPPSGIAIWKHELQDELERVWCAPLHRAGVSYHTVLLDAPAAEGLMWAAEREGADVIVVGAHGHGGITDRVLGSVSYKISHRAHQPVVILPPDILAPPSHQHSGSEGPDGKPRALRPVPESLDRRRAEFAQRRSPAET